ncbi:MAG: hypothetical protein NC114_06490 [Ruminococcus flavefaciens]|nr:hypothetical protein [Ruminococcus flavefaciens]
MKALFVATKKETNALVNGINEVSDLFCDKNVITGEMIHNAKKNAERADVHHFAGGWAQFRGEKNVEGDTSISDYAIEISAEEDATVLMIQAMVKMIVYFAPVITPLLSVWVSLKSLSKNWKDFAHSVGNEFREKFHKPSTYANMTIFSEEADVAAVVIIKKDGYGNEPYIVESVEITDGVGIDMLTRLWKQMEARVDTATEYYPHAEYIFDNIEDARENMEKGLVSLRKDYFGMKNARAESSSEIKETADDPIEYAAVLVTDGKSDIVDDVAMVRVIDDSIIVIKHTHNLSLSDDTFSERVRVALKNKDEYQLVTKEKARYLYTNVVEAFEGDPAGFTADDDAAKMGYIAVKI